MTASLPDRFPSDISSRYSLSRRGLLFAGAGVVGVHALTQSGWQRDGLQRTAERAVYTQGTTLHTAAAAESSFGYSRLRPGPGFPLQVRADLGTARGGRDARRTPLASVVQLTDLHVVDAQSPVRFEWLHPSVSSSFRPQESLATQGGAQLVQRINELAVGPFSGRRFDCVVSTGDATDNNEAVEMDWYLTVLNGGVIQANTGAPDRWEGVQSNGEVNYYQPATERPDNYKEAGFPAVARLLEHAIRPHVSSGLDFPWYAVVGNHDNSIEGTIPTHTMETLFGGRFKFSGYHDNRANEALARVMRGDSRTLPDPSSVLRNDWEITADERRLPVTRADYIRRHVQAGGHGLTAEAAEQVVGYYSWSIAPGVLGISLDSTNPAGFVNGSVGAAQLEWLRATLAAHRDEYVFVFSHHNIATMDNLQRDPDRPDESRHSGDEVSDLLVGHANVLAWVNGHTHRNRITARRGGKRGFWEITTASHIDFPQHARILDLVDNRDGSVSIFTTLIESAAPYQASYDAPDQASLASLYREFAYNDLHFKGIRQGTLGDRNAELVIAKPAASA